MLDSPVRAWTINPVNHDWDPIICTRRTRYLRYAIEYASSNFSNRLATIDARLLNGFFFSYDLHDIKFADR